MTTDNTNTASRAEGTVPALVGLLPCPFCGGPAEIIDDRRPGWFEVRCAADRHSCDVGPSTFCHRDQQTAIGHWNRRANVTDQARGSRAEENA